MGKKKVIKQTQEQALQESEQLEKNISKAATAKVSASRRIDQGRVYVNATYNNTMMTATNKNGDVIAWVTSGGLGFAGPKKATPFAASKAASALAEKLKKVGMTTIDIVVKGVGSGRDSAVRALANQGFTIASIKDITPIPHNGPKPPKPRRV